MATRELYDLDNYKSKALEAITKLKSQPVQKKRGPVGKVDVLNEVRTEILELVDAGYSIKAICDAFANDVFKILPKTITESIKNERKAKDDAIRAERKAAEPAAEQKPKTARKAKTIKVTEQPKAPEQLTIDDSTFPVMQDEPV